MKKQQLLALLTLMTLVAMGLPVLAEDVEEDDGTVILDTPPIISDLK